MGNQEEFMENIMKNPKKILSLVKDIGSKLEEKMKSGDVKQSELLEEATEIMEKIKDIPGLKQMMSKMGMSGNFDFKAMANKMEQTMKSAKTKERLNKKREERASAKASFTQKDENTFSVKVDDTTQPKSQKPKKAKRNKKKKANI
jgi:predicted phosphohydrolase